MLRNLVAAIVVASFTAGAAFAETPAAPAATPAAPAAKEQAVDCKAIKDVAQKAACEKKEEEAKKEAAPADKK